MASIATRLELFEIAASDEALEGGHFAALEEPAALAEEIRAFFRPLRKG